MADGFVDREAVQKFIEAANYRITIIFPEGRPLLGWCDKICRGELGEVIFYVAIIEEPKIVEGIQVGEKYFAFNWFQVIGGMVTCFPLKEGVTP